MQPRPFWISPQVGDRARRFIKQTRLGGNPTMACQREARTWAKAMLDAGFDVSLHGGFYQDGDALDPDEMVGHAWLEVDGGIFDPTAAQFDSAPESWRYEDTEHALEGNELRDALSRADVARLGNPALQPHERRARAHERLVDEHHPLLHLPARSQNPLASTAFETYHEQYLEGRHKLDWTPYRMEEAMHAAEKRFAVALVGPLYGCGTYGCAAPLMDGRVLKVTIDEYEARWARLTRRYQVPGMVQIDTSPVVVGLDDWYNGEPPEADEDMVPVAPFKIWAYVREQASDLPDPTNWPPRLRSSRVEKLHEGHQFFRSLGYELGDWQRPDNVGLNQDGHVVVRDGRVSPRLSPRRRQNPHTPPKAAPWIFRDAFVYALTRRPASPWTVPKGFSALGPATEHLPFGTVTFARPLPRAQIEAFELEPLDPDDPIVLKRALQIYRDEVYKTFSRTNGFDQPDAEGGHTTLSYSTRQGVKYQVTFWLPDWTPTGHLDVNDFDEAVGSLWSSMPKAERQAGIDRAVWHARA